MNAYHSKQATYVFKNQLIYYLFIINMNRPKVPSKMSSIDNSPVSIMLSRRLSLT